MSQKYNENHEQERIELDYYNLDEVERLKIDLTFALADLYNLEKRNSVLESRINKSIERLEPFEDGDSSLSMLVLKILRGDNN